MSDTAHAPVTVTLLQTEPVRGMGPVTHLCVVDVEWAGIGFQVQGVRVQRGPDGCPRVLPPVWRHPGNGRWLPGLILPDVLQAAIAAEVLAAVQDAPGRAPGGGGAGLPPPGQRASGGLPCGPPDAPMMGGGSKGLADRGPFRWGPRILHRP